MGNENGHLREFGKFRLDAERRVLWFGDEPVNLPLKEIEVLCVLTENGGQVVTKDEILNRVWADSFVEESNLSRHIYLLRKTFRDHGESNALIQTVPRRGYRFAGEVSYAAGSHLVIERHSVSQTLIEKIDDSVEPAYRERSSSAGKLMPRTIVLTALCAAITFAAVAGFYFYSGNAQASAANSITSIAVLPLRSIDETENDRALNFGFADSLIRGLGRVSDVRVVSAGAVAKYADLKRESVEIGRELGVDAILDGALQQSNGKLRISLRLIRTSDGSQIWSGLFTESETEVFRLQEAIASQSAQALAVNLKPKNSAKRPTDNLEAYHAYLKGDYLFRLRGIDNVARSAQFFRQAIELDPNFSRAWAGLAAALAMGVEIGEAENALIRGLELDPDLAEAHATRGFIRMFHYWDWNEAEKSLVRAIELDPNSVEAHHWLGVLRSFHGRLDEAKAEMHRALDLDPLSTNLLSDIGQLHYFAREYDEAEQYCLKAKSIDPDYASLSYLRLVYKMQGRGDEAFETQTNVWCANYDSDKLKADCRERTRKIYYREGWKGLLKNSLNSMSKRIERGEMPASRLSHTYSAIAEHYLWLGDDDRAIENLTHSLEAKTNFEIMNFSFPYLRVDPQYAALHDDPRFQEILRKINL